MTVIYSDRTTPLAKNSGNSSATSEALSWDFTAMGALAEGEAWLYAGATNPALVKTGTISSVTRNSIPGRQAAPSSLYEYTSATNYGLQIGTGDFQIAIVISTGASLPTTNNFANLFEVRNAGGTILASVGISEFSSNGWYMNASSTPGIGTTAGAVYYGINKTVIFWLRRRSGTLSGWTQEAAAGSTLTRRYNDASNSTTWDSSSATRTRALYNSAATTIDVSTHSIVFWSGSFDDATTQTIGQDFWGLWANSSVSDSLAITSPTASSSIATTTTISGTYTGTAPTSVQVQHGAGTWTTLTGFSASAGAWTGGVTLPAASSAALRARYGNNTAIVSADITAITVVADGIAFTVPPTTADGAVPYRLFQRNGSNQASVRITGTYTGTPTSIQYRYNAGAWATLVASPTGGVFDATVTLTGPAQGALDVRFSNSTGVTASLAAIGVGDLYLSAGQSNHMGASTSYVAPGAPVAHTGWKAIKFGYDHTWSENVETSGNKFSSPPGAVYAAYTGTDSAGGSYFGALSTIAMASGVPVGFVACAKGSTTLGNWSSASTATSTLYGALLATAQLVGSHKAVLWWQGEAEMGGSGTAANWAADMATIMAKWATDGQTTQWLLIEPCWAANGSTANGTTVRAQIASLSGNSHVLGIVDMDSPSPAYAGIHYNSPAEITTVSSRVAAALGYSGTSSYTVTVRLADATGAAVPGVTGLYWALLSSLPPSAAIVAQGTAETSDGLGDVVIDATSSGLTTGASAWLLLTDGAAAPSTKGRIVPVTVA